MKTFKIFMLVGVMSSLALFTKSNPIKDKSSYAASDKGFAVIELFTSEGCSSCPPADQLVARIEKESHDQPVYILAYHVDYWNRLGWKDVFSDHAYSVRQQQYSKWLNTDQVYTPQVIVNGKKEFVGSEEGTLRNAIKAGLQSSSAYHLNLSVVKSGNKYIEVQYHADAPKANEVLIVAVVQKSGVTNVKRGENSGHTLAHVQIVRNLKTVALNGKSSGNAVLELPSDFGGQYAEIIALIQNSTNGMISAAAKVPLNDIRFTNAVSSK
ncbi:DUF1223 domain-containing protein [Mucilaginibacter daejeonensis]|uniref:DUF1223 domain-containing protein n=1 Tax=Mucilaginibacter daejeonensis TaxID=398049 RepID=UPI001D17A891|nr:DUF1223 domain-containing protein [Mucilaginibacter daejeonensis]UEG54866.1 DUF1223 domain-containing protein [Mucilaginibacter daejeonensis]